jgi:hypothetical protein
VLVFCCASSISLFAQDELIAVPNRPTVSTPAQPVQRGVLETEWGVDAASSYQDLNGLLKFGVSKNFELRVTDFPILATSGTHGTGDATAGFKYRITQDSRHAPSIAFMYMVKAPTAGDGLGSGEVDHVFTFLASKDLRKHHFDFNLSANLLGRSSGGGFDRSYLNALAWSHPAEGKWGVTVEVSGITSPVSSAPGSAQFLASALYTVKPRLIFDAGIVRRITGNIPNNLFIAGFTYSIANLYSGKH